MIQTNRVMPKVVAILTTVIGVFSIVGRVSSDIAVNAATSGLMMAATIEPSMTLTLSDSNKVLDIVPSSLGSFSSTSVTVGAYSNGGIGYTLTMTPENVNLVGSSTNIIPTLSASSTCTGGSNCDSSNFTVDRWGIAINDAVYSPVATTNLITVASTNMTAESNIYTIHLGANLDFNVPNDNYSTTINFAMTSSLIATYDVTFNFDSGISNLAVEDTSGNALSPTISSSGTATYTLDYANTYTINPTYISGYRLHAATLAGSGILNDNLMTYTVGASASTIDLASFPIYMQSFASFTSSELTELKNSMVENQQYEVIDNRDNSIYTVALMEDGNIWMTQNLDLCIGCTDVASLTSANTDLNEYDTNGNGSGTTFVDYSYENGVITWTPTLANTNGTVTGSPAYIASAGGTQVTGWSNEFNNPYMMEMGDVYSYQGTRYESLSSCESDNHTKTECGHYRVGNFYNWPAAVAMSNTSAYTSDNTVMPNSICPAGWKLPNGLTNNGGAIVQSDFNVLLTDYGIAGSADTVGSVNVAKSNWATVGYVDMGLSPLYFVRSGYVDGSAITSFGTAGVYWSSTVRNANYAYYLFYNANLLYPAHRFNRYLGWNVRCMVR